MKSNILYNNDDLYFSSEDSEDELDRCINNSKLNTIQSNFSQKLINSPILFRKYSVNADSSFTKNLKNTNVLGTNSDMPLIKFNKHKPRRSNYLNFFTFEHKRETYLKINEENYINDIRNLNIKYNKVDWKLIYDIFFVDNRHKNQNNLLDKTKTIFSDLFNNTNLTEEKKSFDNNIEKYRLQILINKIKHRLKKKYEYVQNTSPDDDETLNNKYKKINKIPEMVLNIRKNENNLRSAYKVGISEFDKNKFIPMVINKLKKKFSIYLDKKSYEKIKYLNSLRNNSYDDFNIGEKRFKKKNDKNKKIKFGKVNKKFKAKYSISEEKLSNLMKNKINVNGIKTKRKTTSKNLNIKPKFDARKSFIPNDKITYLFNPRKTLALRTKNDSNSIKKRKISDNNLNIRNYSIVFNENELNMINRQKKQKVYLSDNKLEQFKKNAKTIINDEILFKEFNKEYPDYEDELYNLQNDFLLYEKIYDKQEIRNYSNLKKSKDYNHNINNYLSFNNKINLSVMKKYDINNKILEGAVNLQNIINFLKE